MRLNKSDKVKLVEQLQRRNEFLELVQLTRLHILKQLPYRRVPNLPQPKAAFSPPPKVEIKPPPPPLPPQPIPEPVAITYKEPNEILELLKVHCPNLTLIDPPKKKKLALILFENEKGELLINLAKAIQNEGYSAELIQASLVNATHIQDSSTLLIGERLLFASTPFLKQQARKTPSGNNCIGKALALIIPPLLDPASKRSFWVELKKCLLSHVSP